MDKEKIEELLEQSPEAQEYVEKSVEASGKRMAMITRMVKQHFSALTPSGKLSPQEMLSVGIDTILSGYSIVSRYLDMVEAPEQERINVVSGVKLAVDDVLSKSLLKKEVVQQKVLDTTIHNLKANKLMK